MGFIDTHSHLQAEVLEGRLDALLDAARRSGVESIVICAGSRGDWARVRDIARRYGLPYTLGIHPLFAAETTSEDLADLKAAFASACADPFFIGVGEIGLDGTVPGAGDARAEAVFAACLKAARDLKLPVSLHVRKSASRVLYGLRRIPPAGGALHAFNGSDVERAQFLALGLKLGFGGAVTYDGSLRIRRHATELPEGCWVLETDAPDMPGAERRDAAARLGTEPLTEPADIVRTAEIVANLRGTTLENVARVSREAALEAFPRLRAVLSHPEAFACR